MLKGTTLSLISASILLMICAVAFAAPQFVSQPTHNGTDDFYYDGDVVYFFANISEVNVSGGGSVALNCSSFNGSSELTYATNISFNFMTGTHFQIACPVDYENALPTPSSEFTFVHNLLSTTLLQLNATNSSGDGINITNVSTPFILTYNLTVPQGLNGRSTDFSSVTNFSAVDFVAEIVGLGMINFTTAIDFANETIGTIIQELPNNIDINGSANPPVLFFNSTWFDTLQDVTSSIVELHLFNMPAAFRVIQKDGSFCNSATCANFTVIENTDGTFNLTFSGVGFSNYTVENDTVPPAFVENHFNASNLNPTTGDTIDLYANWTDASLQAFNLTARLYRNGTLVSAQNTTGDFDSQAFANFSVTYSDTEAGVWNYTINASDTAGNSNVTFGIIVTVTDGTNPVVTVSYPADNFNTTATNISFNYTVTDNIDTSLACNLTLDSETNQSGVATLNGTASTLYAAENLSEGDHTWSIICYDDADNNNESVTRTFTVDSTAPTIDSVSPANTSNVSDLSPAFTVVVSDVNSEVVDLNYTVSGTACSTSGTYDNNTAFYPFNVSGCNTAEETVVVTINASDTVGNVRSLEYQYFLDNAAPTMVNVSIPQEGVEYTNSVNLTWVVNDSTKVNTTGYYLDNNSLVIPSAIQTGDTYSFEINLSAGAHTIKFFANDSQANSVNSSLRTFFVNAEHNMTLLAEDLLNHVGGDDLESVEVRLANGTIVTENQQTNQSIDLVLITNTSGGAGLNVTLSLSDGLAASWDENFTIQSSNTTNSAADINLNWSTTTRFLVEFNDSLEGFIANESAYFGKVAVPLDLSANVTDVWWFEDENDLGTRTVVSACTIDGNSSAYGPTNTTPCYNVTVVGVESVIFVPHFSTVVATSDLDAPSATLNSPGTLENESSLYFNLTTSLDAQACWFNTLYNDSNSLSTIGNATNSSVITPVTIGAHKSCTLFAGLRNSNYTFTFWVNDSAGNINSSSVLVTVSDTTTPSLAHNSSQNVSVTSSTATISYIADQMINGTVLYGTSLAFSTPATNNTFTSTRQTFTLTSLSASTLYYYNITGCDYTGNCQTLGNFNFTTSAATSNSSDDDDSSSSSSGGGSSSSSSTSLPSSDEAGATIAETSKKWDVVKKGEPITFEIKKSQIAVRGITLSTNKDYNNVGLEVKSINKPSDLSVPSGKEIFQYLDLDASNLPDSGITSATVEFRVPFTWFNSKGVKRNTIKLMRYDNGWKTLTTNEVRADSLYAYYEATTPGFSFFSITGVKTRTDSGSDDDDESGSGSDGQAGSEGSGEDGSGAADDSGVVVKKERKGGFVKWIFLAIIIIGVGLYLYFTMRKK